MSGPQEWEATLGAVLRRAAAPAPAWTPPVPGVGPVGPVEPHEIESRRADHEVFERSWSGTLATQRQLAAQGWPGVIIPVANTRPDVLRALDMAAIAAGSVVEAAGPAESLSTEEAVAARVAAAQARGVAGAT